MGEKGGVIMEEKRKTSLYKKMTPEELQGLLHLRKRGGKILAKKGKGSKYNRQEFKKGEKE